MKHMCSHTGRKQFFLRPGIWSSSLGSWMLVLVVIAVSGQTEAEAACANSDQCSSDRVCMAPKFPLGMGKECVPKACNFDTECPSARPRCLMGICQNPGFNPNTPPGTGQTQAGVGEACGPYKIGQVTKSRGCKPNLQCVKGHCQQPAQ
jgi:hypothetical protein